MYESYKNTIPIKSQSFDGAYRIMNPQIKGMMQGSGNHYKPISTVKPM